jgi:hypothetical protein
MARLVKNGETHEKMARLANKRLEKTFSRFWFGFPLITSVFLFGGFVTGVFMVSISGAYELGPTDKIYFPCNQLHGRPLSSTIQHPAKQYPAHPCENSEINFPASACMV